ncbi:MAG TPA: hypothetical protein VF810_04770 [Patescibacteria group bacterium]
MKKIFKLKGQTLIELVLAMGLAAVIFPALLTGFMTSREGKAQAAARMQAVALLKENEQAVRSVRNNSWNNFALDGTFHPVLSGFVWTLAPGTAQINNFMQAINISDVYRDNTGAIAASGGTYDPSTKKVVITISWTQPNNSAVTSTLYLTRTNNLTYTDTTFNQFNAGQKAGTMVAYTSGSTTDGQFQLSAGGGGGNWCIPSFLIQSVDLPKSGVANAIAAISGPGTDGSTVFAGTGDNASGVSFAKVNLPGDPPNPSIQATFDGYKTNAVFGNGHYAFLATDNNSQEVVIIDLTKFSDPPTNSKYLQVGAINLPGSVNATSIYVVNNLAYITSSDNKYYIYNISNVSSPQLLGSLTLDGTGEKVLVAGDYSYVATNSTTYQLEIINIDDANPRLAGRLNLGTGQSGVDVYVNTSIFDPSRAYLAVSSAVNQKEFYIVNISNKSSPTVSGLGSYDTNGMNPTGVTVVTGNRAIIVGSGGSSQYQVIDITNEAGPLPMCGSLVYSSGIRGIASVLQPSGYAYSYVLTGDANSELKIILGGAGGNFSSSGTFESATYDAGYAASFNSFSASVSAPLATTLKLQVAASPPVNGSCSGATFTYIGPNGDPTQYFTTTGTTLTGTIPFGNYLNNAYQNPGRCFRYKVWMTTTDQTQTPVVFDFTANYSP